MSGVVLAPELLRGELAALRQATEKPVNLNFFCHEAPAAGSPRAAAWRSLLQSYYVELGLTMEAEPAAAPLSPFNASHAELVEELLRRQTEPAGSSDFVAMWAGQALRLGRSVAAGDLVRLLASETLAKLGRHG